MNLKRTAQPAAAPATSDLDGLLAKLRQFRERDKSLLDLQIELEAANVQPIAPGAARRPREMALEMLNGHAPTDFRGLPKGEQLHDLLIERQAIAEAIEIGRGQELQLRIARSVDILKEEAVAWDDAVRETVRAVLALRRANARRARIREKVVTASGVRLPMRCDRLNGQVFGAPAISDEIYRFLEDVIGEGIMTRREIGDIENAK
jgi:hypothetical protein